MLLRYCYENHPLCVYGENSPTSRITENETLFLNNYGKHETQVTVKTTLAQISSTIRYQITNNNINTTNDSSQRLTADQLAKQTSLARERFFELRRHSKTIVPSQQLRIFIPFLTGCDVT
ncbi:hypothetical protein AVEN_82742-1 [Araneus ventricosus]|uniref:Uncharacterized protein n=1 Tax=Araneus ventricosus TaxID=182803 RepID=A0A4Y2E8X5_ARAVE|nr:hypothetical protein AVEN_82742-1 [Araneus ventricosus]